LERGLRAGLLDPSTTEFEKFDAAKALLNLDPSNEQACRYILTSYGRRGDIANVMRTYSQLVELLKQEHGIRPSAETQRLVEGIQRGEFKTAMSKTEFPARAPAIDARQAREGDISVDPNSRLSDPCSSEGRITIHLDGFETHGVSTQRAYLVSGFRHALAACLVSFREWTVIESHARKSPSQQLMLATNYRLEGTSYQVGEAIHVVLTLLDISQATYVWSEIFELSLDNWFSTQQQIIRHLASTLKVYLSADRLKRAFGRNNVASVSFDNWLRAQVLIVSFDAEKWREARELLRNAKRYSPTFAPLYSSSAQLQNTEGVVYPGIFATVDRTKAAIQQAKQAVLLDPLDSRAHLCLAWSYAVARDF